MRQTAIHVIIPPGRNRSWNLDSPDLARWNRRSPNACLMPGRLCTCSIRTRQRLHLCCQGRPGSPIPRRRRRCRPHRLRLPAQRANLRIRRPRRRLGHRRPPVCRDVHHRWPASFILMGLPVTIRFDTTRISRTKRNRSEWSRGRCAAVRRLAIHLQRGCQARDFFARRTLEALGGRQSRIQQPKTGAP